MSVRERKKRRHCLKDEEDRGGENREIAKEIEGRENEGKRMREKRRYNEREIEIEKKEDKERKSEKERESERE